MLWVQDKRVLHGTRLICDDRNVLFDDSMGAGRCVLEESSDGCPFPVLLSIFQFPCQEDREKAGIARDLCVCLRALLSAAEEPKSSISPIPLKFTKTPPKSLIQG